MQLLGPNDPKQIGGYQLLCPLGQGGMGQVYLGHSPAGVAVAVKIIKPEHASDPGFLVRFRSEVEAAKRVSGAYTAAVLEAGPNDRPPWLVTELVPGPSLAEAVAKAGPLPLNAVWRLAAGLIEALKAVHRCDLVHRDLKPANVLLAASGPKVIDFGISKSVANGAGTRPWPTLPSVTLVGASPGTPGFMAPEQQRFGRAGRESDIYALGKVLAFAATGSIDAVNGISYASIGPGAAPRPEFARIQGELRRLLAGCLAFEPEDRPSLEQLMTMVLAETRRYGRAASLDFWREPLTDVIRAKVEELHRQLDGDPEGARRPGTEPGGWRPPADPGGRPPGNAPRPSVRMAFEARGNQPPADNGLGFQPTQDAAPGRNPAGQPWGAASVRLGRGAPIARGLSGSLFAVYRPRTRFDRRAPGPKSALAYALDGDDLFDGGRFPEARDCYNRSIELDPEDAGVQVDLGRAYHALQQLMSAENAFLEAIKLDWLLIAAHRNRYLAVDMMTGRQPELAEIREESQDACADVLRAEAGDAAALANRGDAYCCLSRYPEALGAYADALSMDPANARLIAKREYARRQAR